MFLPPRAAKVAKVGTSTRARESRRRRGAEKRREGCPVEQRAGGRGHAWIESHFGVAAQLHRGFCEQHWLALLGRRERTSYRIGAAVGKCVEGSSSAGNLISWRCNVSGNELSIPAHASEELFESQISTVPAISNCEFL